MDTDLWLHGIVEALKRSGCWELGCPILLYGDPGAGGRGRLVLVHQRKVRFEVTEEMVRGLPRVGDLGITAKLVEQLKQAHADGDVPPRIEVEDATAAG
jgi:hypothetical protein